MGHQNSKHISKEQYNILAFGHKHPVELISNTTLTTTDNDSSRSVTREPDDKNDTSQHVNISCQSFDEK